MEWFLLIYFVGATQFQTMGPWPDKANCETSKEQVEAKFKDKDWMGRKVVHSDCVSYAVGAK